MCHVIDYACAGRTHAQLVQEAKRRGKLHINFRISPHAQAQAEDRGIDLVAIRQIIRYGESDGQTYRFSDGRHAVRLALPGPTGRDMAVAVALSGTRQLEIVTVMWLDLPRHGSH